MTIAAILTFLPQILSAGKTLWAFVEQIRTAAQQSAEWTPEHEAQFQDALLAMGNAPESQPDSVTTPGTVTPAPFVLTSTIGGVTIAR